MNIGLLKPIKVLNFRNQQYSYILIDSVIQHLTVKPNCKIFNDQMVVTIEGSWTVAQPHLVFTFE